MLIALLAIAALAFLFYQADNIKMVYTVGVAAILTIIFYPLYLRDLYMKHYKRYVREHLKNRFGSPCSITFGETSLLTTDITGESKINYEAFESIVETGSYHYLVLKIGGSVIIPKQRVNNPGMLRNTLSELANQQRIPYKNELSWKWK